MSNFAVICERLLVCHCLTGRGDLWAFARLWVSHFRWFMSCCSFAIVHVGAFRVVIRVDCLFEGISNPTTLAYAGVSAETSMIKTYGLRRTKLYLLCVWRSGIHCKYFSRSPPASTRAMFAFFAVWCMLRLMRGRYLRLRLPRKWSYLWCRVYLCGLHCTWSAYSGVRVALLAWDCVLYRNVGHVVLVRSVVIRGEMKKLMSICTTLVTGFTRH